MRATGSGSAANEQLALAATHEESTAAEVQWLALEVRREEKPGSRVTAQAADEIAEKGTRRSRPAVNSKAQLNQVDEQPRSSCPFLGTLVRGLRVTRTLDLLAPHLQR